MSKLRRPRAYNDYMNTTRSQSGFTIVETLVAITVLMIAIAGPLSIASKGLTAALAARDQLIASYLAQESMELVKNIRDNNIAQGLPWLNATTVLSNCRPANPCDIEIVSGVITPFTPSIVTGSDRYRLYLQASGYSHQSGGGPTSPFVRAIYLSDVGTNNPCSSNIECTVTVVVDWNEGTIPYNVTISSNILNTER